MSKVARAALAPLPADSLIGLAETTFSSGDATARRGAAEALAQVAGSAARSALQAQAKAEKSKATSDAIAALVSQIDSLQKAGPDIPSREKVAAGAAPQGTVLRAIDGTDIVIPPMPPLPADPPLPLDALEPLRAAIPAYNAAARDQNEKEKARAAAHHQAHGWSWKPHEVPEIDPETAIPEFHSFLNGTGAAKHDFAMFERAITWVPKEAEAAYKRLVNRSEATPWHLLRLTHPGRSNWAGVVWYCQHGHQHGHHAAELAARCGQVGDIRVPIAIAERLGGPRGHAAREMLREWGAPYRGDEVPSLAFHVYEHLDLIEERAGSARQTGADSSSTSAPTARPCARRSPMQCWPRITPWHAKRTCAPCCSVP